MPTATTATSTPTLLSQLAYAKRRGCTHGAVQKAIKAGRLSRSLHTDAKGKVLIDPVVADQEWASNTNAAKAPRAPETETLFLESPPAAESPAPAARARGESLQQQSPALGGLVGAGERAEYAASGGDDAGEVSFADARAMRERYQALLSQLEYELRSGRVIEADEARVTAYNAARRTRDLLLSIADRLAPVVAGLTDQHACHQAISAEVRRVCAELSEHPLGAPQEG